MGLVIHHSLRVRYQTCVTYSLAHFTTYLFKRKTVSLKRTAWRILQHTCSNVKQCPLNIPSELSTCPVHVECFWNFSKWNSSSSTLRQSTVTGASRPRRKRTSSSAPSPPSSPRFKTRKLRRTLSVYLLALAHIDHTASYRAPFLRGWFHPAGVFGNSFCGWFSRVSSKIGIFSLVVLPLTVVRRAGGSVGSFFAGGLFRTRVLARRVFCLSCVRQNSPVFCF